MRVALLAIVLLLASCAGGGSTGVISGPAPFELEARVTKAQGDVQTSIRYFTAQSNSCTAPSQWFPAENCALSAEQLAALKTGIEDNAVPQVNKATRTANEWRVTHDPAMQAQLVEALDVAEKTLKSLGVPGL